MDEEQKKELANIKAGLGLIMIATISTLILTLNIWYNQK